MPVSLVLPDRPEGRFKWGILPSTDCTAPNRVRSSGAGVRRCIQPLWMSQDASRRPAEIERAGAHVAPFLSELWPSDPGPTIGALTEIFVKKFTIARFRLVYTSGRVLRCCPHNFAVDVEK